MNPTISLGRIAGVQIGLNWSWLIALVLITWSLASSVFPSENPGLGTGTYTAMAVAAAVLFFSSLLLHELGHAVQARREGMQIDGITLWLFGGVARFKGMFPSAGAEFRIAIAGPLVTLVLGGAFVALARFTRFSQQVDGVAAWLGYINLFLLAFNLLPALPLDGGRVLRSALWAARRDFRWATVIAANIGRAFGYAMIASGLVLFVLRDAVSGMWIAFLGWFLLTAAGSEARYMAVRDTLAGIHVDDLMVHDPVTARAGATIGEFLHEVAGTVPHTAYPVVRDGRAVGLLPLRRVTDTPRSDWAAVVVDQLAYDLDEVPVLREDDEAVDALNVLASSRLRRGLVVRDGLLVGLLSLNDLARTLLATSPTRPLRSERSRS